MKYAMWYDNGSGYLESYKEVDSIVFDNYPYRQVATLGWKQDPNEDPQHILAESGDVVRLYHVTLNGEEGVDQNYDWSFELQAKSGDAAMTASQLFHGCLAVCYVEVKPDAILVGRHVSEDLPFRIVEQRNVVFSTNVDECVAQVEELFDAAYKANAVLLFQNTPGIVAVAISRIAARSIPTHLRGVGVIISKPGERPTGAEHVINLPYFRDDGINAYSSDSEPGKIIAAIKFANPNAKIDGDKIIVDPPMKFVFDKVEWFF